MKYLDLSAIALLVNVSAFAQTGETRTREEALTRSVSSGVCIARFAASTPKNRAIEIQTTAFLVDGSGLFLTVKHLTPIAKTKDESLTIECPYSGYDFGTRKGRPPLAASRIKSHKSLDMQVLRVESLPDDVHPLYLRDADSPLGATLTIIGYYPQDGFPTPLVRSLQLEQRVGPVFHTNGSVLKGMSGSPLLDSYGRVSGMFFLRKDIDKSNAPIVGAAIGISAISEFVGKISSGAKLPFVADSKGRLIDRAIWEWEEAKAKCPPTFDTKDIGRVGTGPCDSNVVMGTVKDPIGGHVCSDPYRNYRFPC